MKEIKETTVLGYNVQMDLGATSPECVWYESGLGEMKHGNNAAVVTVSPINESGKRGVRVYDFRRGCVELARFQKNLNQNEAQTRETFGHELVDMQKAAITKSWPSEFTKNAMVTLGEEINDKGRFTVVILSDAKDQPVDGLLAATRFTTGTGIGAYTISRDARKGSWLREVSEKGIADTFDWLIMTFTNAEAKILIIHRTITDKKFVMTDISIGMGVTVYQRYGTIDKEICINRKPIEAAATEADNKPIEAIGEDTPTNAAEPIEIEIDGETEEIDEEGDDNEITNSEVDDDTTNETKTLLEDEAEKLGLTTKEINLLEEAGFGTVESLADADHEIVTQGTKIKKGRATQLIKMAAAIIN